MKGLLLAISLLLIAAYPAQVHAGEEGPSCPVVHGRLFVANGTPSIRIWKIGTRRILGVVSPDDHDSEHPSVFAKEVWALIDGHQFHREVYGDFLVCPVTRSRPGWMQMVTLLRGFNLVVRDLPDAKSAPEQ